MTERPNVLILVVDSLRARNVGYYGHNRATTPFLDELARESLVYESAWAPGIWTLPSHVSMFTGYEVPEHGVLSYADAVDPKEVLFSRLSRRGYETGVFSENTWLTEAEMGIRSAFETVVGKPSVLYPDAIRPGEFVYEHDNGDYLAYLREAIGSGKPARSIVNGVSSKLTYDYPRLADLLLPDTDGFYFADAFNDWRANRSGEWAACINLMDAHRPYEPAAEYDQWDDGTARNIQDSLDRPAWAFLEGDEPLWKLEALESLYDGGIRQADECIREIVASLRETGEFEDTLFIVVGDHGEAFGEYSHIRDGPAVEHKQGLHPVQAQVPLIINPPRDRNGRVEQPVSITETDRVVTDVVAGGPVRYEREQPVLSVYNGIEPGLVSGRVRQMDDPGLQSVIDRREGVVMKHTQYTNCSRSRISEALPDAQSLEVVEDYGTDITTVFHELEASTKLRTDAAIDSSAEQRLEELGYL